MKTGTNGHNGHNGHNGFNGIHPVGRTLGKTGRDMLAILFRQRGVVIASFLGLSLAAALIYFFVLNRYESQTMILVQNSERADPVVTGQSNAQPALHEAVTPDQMTSELELLRSRDLLEQVVDATGLDSQPLSLLQRLRGYQKMTKQQRIEKAARDLADKLDVQILRDTDLISVAYPAKDPQLAARVLQTLDDLYLKKHVAVHRPAGTSDFFQRETQQYAKSLSQAEGQLVGFVHDQGVAFPQLERDTTLAKLSDFEALAGQNQAGIAETEQRIHELQGKLATIPARQTTMVTTSDSGQLLEQLKGQLLTLELQRIDLLEKYNPEYRPVKEVEKQIAETHAAIQEAEKSQLRQETTDRDPNFEMVRENLTKSQADLAGFKARAIALGQAVNGFRTKALRFESQDVHQKGLLRAVQTSEDNYLLYLRKQEEARIAEALDSRGILNVTVAEAALVPTLPVHSGLFYLVLGTLLAGLGSVATAFLADHLDPTLRTPEEVEAALNIPLLITVPKDANQRTPVHVS
ncbi:MAG: hypothetical protein DMG21_12640 [Acidobacteria bacterium]|nr:MAG: hypothetical protein DMG21_12640 [Acidobacteriota bacterium]